MFKNYKTETIDLIMPKSFKYNTNQQDYERMLTIIISCFKEKGGELVSVRKGIVNAVLEDKTKILLSLDHLVRVLSKEPKDKWDLLVRTYFNNAKVNMPAQDFFLKDYEHASGLLKVLIKRKHFSEEFLANDLVLMEHFPGTVTALVLHYEHQFRFLTKENIKEWGVPEKELFDQALENMRNVKLYSKGIKLEKDVTVYAMVSQQYSAGRLIEIEQNAPWLVGRRGSLIAIPANGTAFAVPICSEENMRNAVRALIMVTLEAFQTEKSAITFDLFHYENKVVSSMMDFIENEYPVLYQLIQHTLNS